MLTEAELKRALESSGDMMMIMTRDVRYYRLDDNSPILIIRDDMVVGFYTENKKRHDNAWVALSSVASGEPETISDV